MSNDLMDDLEKLKPICQKAASSSDKEESKRKLMMISIDAKSETKDRDAIFEKYGFFRLSPKKELKLPESTYMGKVDSEDAGKDKVKKIWDELKNHKLNPERICGGIVDDWKVIRSKNDKN